MSKNLTIKGKLLQTKPTTLKNTIGFFSLFASIFGFGLFGSTAAMGIAVAGSGIFLAFANLEKFTRFKGAGFEAEMREIVDEANATIENLRSVATPMISSYITNLTNEGMLIDTNIDAKRTRYDDILKLQKELDINHMTIDKAKERFLLVECREVLSQTIKDFHKDSDDETQPKHSYLKPLAEFREAVSGSGYLETPNLEEARVFLEAEHTEPSSKVIIDGTITRCNRILKEINSISLAD